MSGVGIGGGGGGGVLNHTNIFRFSFFLSSTEDVLLYFQYYILHITKSLGLSFELWLISLRKVSTPVHAMMTPS